MSTRPTRVGVSPQTYDTSGATLPAYVDMVRLPDEPVTSKSTYDVEVVWRRQWDRTAWAVELLDRLPGLRWIHTDTAGVDRLPLARMEDRGVQLSNARGAHTPAVAEWALGAMLLCARDLSGTVVASAERRWAVHHNDVLLRGRTVMVLGLGDIGRYLAALCSALGMRVVGVSRSGTAVPGLEVVPVSGSWRELLPEATFLINCLPLTPDTQGLVDAKVLKVLGRPAWLINVGRGHTVIEADLVAALRSRALHGAVLDTVVHEPLPDKSELWGCPGLVVSPHASAFTDTTERLTRELFLVELDRHRAGLAPKNLIDLRRGY